MFNICFIILFIIIFIYYCPILSFNRVFFYFIFISLYYLILHLSTYYFSIYLFIYLKVFRQCFFHAPTSLPACQKFLHSSPSISNLNYLGRCAPSRSLLQTFWSNSSEMSVICQWKSAFALQLIKVSGILESATNVRILLLNFKWKIFGANVLTNYFKIGRLIDCIVLENSFTFPMEKLKYNGKMIVI